MAQRSLICMISRGSKEKDRLKENEKDRGTEIAITMIENRQCLGGHQGVERE